MFCFALIPAATAVNNNTSKQPYQTQPSTFSRAATARSHASLSPAARLVQRGPPPRFRPWMIILVTMALGFLFIGIVLTVVAHWPGFTSIGSDPLEIVGPVLLAAGEWDHGFNITVWKFSFASFVVLQVLTKHPQIVSAAAFLYCSQIAQRMLFK